MMRYIAYRFHDSLATISAEVCTPRIPFEWMTSATSEDDKNSQTPSEHNVMNKSRSLFMTYSDEHPLDHHSFTHSLPETSGSQITPACVPTVSPIALRNINMNSITMRLIYLDIARPGYNLPFKNTLYGMSPSNLRTWPPKVTY